MTDKSWERRSAIAFALRAAAIVVPLAAGATAAIVANRELPLPDTLPESIVRALAVVAWSTVVIRLFDRVLRRVLPLATLLHLSLVFPDKAPSRFRVALKAGSSRRAANAVAQAHRDGLSNDPSIAAEEVLVLVGSLGRHDRRTRGHSERVRLYTDLIGEEMGLSPHDRQRLQWSAMLHDIGKLRVPPAILNKPGKLDDEEWEIMRAHPGHGRELLGPLLPFLGEWAAGVWGHHERWDGNGYPDKLDGSNMSRAAAIVAVADSYEVMTATRSYKKPMSAVDARAELTRCAGSHFSPEVVRAFLSISLGRLGLAMGPIAAMAHIPFLRAVADLPGTVGAAVNGGLTSAAASVAPAVVIGAMAMSASASSGAPELASQTSPVVVSTVAPALGAARNDGSGATATPRVSRAAATPDEPPTSVPSEEVPTPTTIADKGAPPQATTTTTLGLPPSTTAPPTTAAPTTTVAPAPPTTAPSNDHAVLFVSDNEDRGSPRLLEGTAVDHSRAYVFVVFGTSTTNALVTEIAFYRDDDTTAWISTDDAAPYDMAGTLRNGKAMRYRFDKGDRAVRAVITWSDGHVQTIQAAFTSA